MIIENGPYQICRMYGISGPQLEHMILNSAVYTHIWANRRYKDWIFDVDMEEMRIYKMAKYQPPKVDKWDGKVIDRP